VLGGPDPGAGPTLRVMSSNLKVGGADAATIVALVRDQHIDLLALEEFTPQEKDRLDASGLHQLLPISAITPRPGAYGIGIYSRYPLTDAGVVTLTGGLVQQYATVLVPHAAPLLFQASHTRAPDMPSYIGDWTHSIDEEPPATPGGPVRLLAGDFNATLDHARLRALLDTGYIDIASQLGDGLTTTWPYDGRHVPPITLDHVFADPRIGAVSLGASVVPGTDHRAIFASLTLPAN
jgi:endonuclease/exonuclease/phosphatase (EEP) superfamily protein YafD